MKKESTMKKPIRFVILKIVGLVGIIVTITGIVLTIQGFGDFESNNFMIGGFLTVFGIMSGFYGIIMGFGPEIAKSRIKTARYIQEENKKDLTDIATNNAEIMSGAVTTTVGAVQEGMKATKFCKHCGKKIDDDARFCPSCGKEQ
jgi:hypothetical protein